MKLVWVAYSLSLLIYAQRRRKAEAKAWPCANKDLHPWSIPHYFIYHLSEGKKRLTTFVWLKCWFGQETMLCHIQTKWKQKSVISIAIIVTDSDSTGLNTGSSWAGCLRIPGHLYFQLIRLSLYWRENWPMEPILWKARSLGAPDPHQLSVNFLEIGLLSHPPWWWYTSNKTNLDKGFSFLTGNIEERIILLTD